MSRKLASVRRIGKISPIEGADRIVLAHVAGWQVITQKANFQEGDLCVFFEVDSFLPVRPEFEFLRKTGFKSTTNLGDGFRLRTMKMRGHISQGLVLPVSEIPELQANPGLCTEGTDITELLGVQLYEKPVPAQLQGRATNFPIFLWKTDQERVQNLIDKIKNVYHDDMFEITQKLDGASMIVYKKGDKYGVCSPNWEIEEPIEGEVNAFWQAARDQQLFEVLRQLDCDCAFQGELMGPGIQGNPEGLAKPQFFLYDAFDITEQRRLLPMERRNMVEHMRKGGYPMLHCPVLGYRTLSSIANDPEQLLEALLGFAEGFNMSGKGQREGVVFKHLEVPFTFEVISNKYLLAEKD